MDYNCTTYKPLKSKIPLRNLTFRRLPELSVLAQVLPGHGMFDRGRLEPKVC